MKKLIIIINGSGNSGKDTICKIVSKNIHAKTISAITPILEIAKTGGWNGEKDDKSRKLLSDLKQLFINYNNLPSRYLLSEAELFSQDNNDVLFVHIREAEEIDKFKREINIPCKTLLVKRPNIQRKYGNDADDLVENYIYDYIFINDRNFDEFYMSIVPYFNRILTENGVNNGNNK
jgi:hypothetical protein